MPIYVWLIVFHPILVTLPALIVLVLLLRWTGWWVRYKYRILLALLAAYVVDAAFALPRILFAYGLPKDPVVTQQIPPPKSLVLVSTLCEAKCHDLLLSGAVDEIIAVTPRQPRYADVTTAVRYRAGWELPGACPQERARANWLASAEQRQSGYCPLVEPVEIPKQGVFVVHEGTNVLARESARPYTPTYLTKTPPGPVIRFFGMEVQNRTADGTTVLASAYRYEAPGLLGLPPLIGCWDRPDNVLFILPPGDTGCGLWRWFTGGGNHRAAHDSKWVFERAFGPADRPLVPPKRPELPPPTPAQALEILSRVWGTDISLHLPRLREALLDPAIPDQAFTDLFVRRAQRGEGMEGSLIAFLGANRPGALTGLSSRLERMPNHFLRSGAVLDEMERNAGFRDQFADTMFLFLESRWETRDNINRFLKLMETSHPGWLCQRLGLLMGPDGIRRMRENGGMMNGALIAPPFMPVIVEATAPRCPDATVDLLQSLPRSPDLASRFCELQKKGGLQGASAKTREFCPP